MTRASSRSAAAAVVVGVVAAALVGTLPDPPQADVPTVTATAEPVDRTVLVCPPGRAGDQVGTASVAGLPVTGEGRVELTLEQRGKQPRTVSRRRGDAATTSVGPSAVLVRGEGASARGVMAVRGDGQDSSTGAAACTAPRPTWWFAGAGGGVDHSSVLFLTNADAGPAVVDVLLHGATGSVDEAGTRGLTLAPGQTLRLPLAEVAPGSDELTVEVASTRGRVSAQVLDRLRTPRGEARGWLAPAAAPADHVLLPGIAPKAGQVRLLVTNPGEQQALVDLQVLTEDGAFVPLGTEQVSVDPGAVERVDLTEELEGRAAGVRLVSEVPVTGTVRVATGRGVGYAGSADPLTGPSGTVLGGGRSEVQVAAGDEPVSLQLLLHDRRGRQLLRRAVTVPPAGLVRVAAPAGAAYAVLLPRSGGGYPAVVRTGGGPAVLPVTTLPTTVLRAVVTPWDGQSAS